MGLQLGERGLPLPADFMETPSSRIGKGVGVHKRAYAKIRYIGHPDDKSYVKKDGCADNSLTSIESNVQQTHSNLLSSEGGRLTPKPVLESISMANDGGQDISDAMLFELSAKCKVYNKTDFDAIDRTFFTPGHRCAVDIGWVGGQAKTITGDICGFDFSINQDLSYDVTIKIGGMTDSVKGADLIFGKGIKFDGLTYEDPETEDEITPTDVISALTAASTLNTSQAFAGRARPYSNDIVGSLVTVKHVNDEGGWSNFWGTNKESMDYINLESLVKLINKNVTVGKVFGKDPFLFGIKFENDKIDTEIFSADPYTMLLSHNPNALTYGFAANFTGLKDGGSPESNIYLSIPFLQTQYDQMKNPPSTSKDGGENKEKAVSTVKYLQSVFNKIKDCSGGYIRLYFYSDPRKEGQLVIANKGNDIIINKGSQISMTNGYENGVRDINITSNLDSDMIAIATNAAMSGKYSSHLDNLYPGCYRAAEDGQQNETGKSAKDRLVEAKKGLGDRISEDDVTTAKSALKTYVQGLNVIPVLTYSLEATVTFDGYTEPDGGPRYGDAFTIDRLPSRMNGANIFFIVTKIQNEFSAGDWTTSVTGLMMVGK